MKKNNVKNIGIEADLPKNKCDDKHCPFHSSLKVRGRIFTGDVIKKYIKTVTVRWNYQIYVPKYERYMKKRSKIKAHNPICIEANIGDKVGIVECRPISKTKKFVVVKKLNGSAKEVKEK